MAGKYHYTVSANFCAIEADTIEELNALLKEFVNDDETADLVKEFKAATAGQAAVAAAPSGVAVAQEVLGGTVIAETANAPEVVTDKWGAVFTYGLADAPRLPDGRGDYIKKEWVSQKGKALIAWVDPTKGPKPARPGEVEAKIIYL